MIAKLKSKLPDCPKCDEDELWVQTFSGALIVKCYLCGWSMVIALPATVDDLGEKIATEVVRIKTTMRNEGLHADKG